MSKSLSIAYAMKKKAKKMADGGPVIDPDKAKDFIKGFTGVREHDDACPTCGYSRGGEVKEDLNQKPDMPMNSHKEGLVDRIMHKRMSKGGVASNEPEESADEMPNEFDDLVLDDNLEANDVGSEELGDEQEADDRSDIVSKILASRRKKDKNPRPA